MKVKIIDLKKPLAVFICFCIILSILSGFFPTRIKAANKTTENVSRIADKNTMDSYQDKLINNENGSRYAGRLWADKSIVNADNSGTANIKLDNSTDGYMGTVSSDADFAHVFSALGSSQVLNNNISLPLDIVFVLDTSSTMAKSYPGASKKRLYKATQALNKAFAAVMENPNNRVALWTYDINAESYLPLDRYEALTEDENGIQQYIIGDSRYDQQEGGYPYTPDNINNIRNYDSQYNHRAQYATLNVKSTTNNQEYKETFSIHSGTNTHQGLYEGLNTLFKVDATKTNIITSNNEVLSLQRIPVVILLSDGEPSLVTTSSNDAFRGPEDENNPVFTGSITNWWEPTNPKFQNVKSENRKNLIGIPKDGSWGLAVPTLLMAAHMKQKVNDHYFGTTNPTNYPGTQIISISVDTEKVNNKNRENLMRATMNPSEWLTQSEYEKKYKDANENNTDYLYTKQVYETLVKYFSSLDDLEFVIDVYGNTATMQHAPQDKDSGVYPINWDTLRYNDAYLDVSEDDLSEYLLNLVDDLKKLGTVFTPVSGTNEAEIDDAITYVDPIGDYMEIKNNAITINKSSSDMSLLLFGQMYSLNKTATLANGIFESDNGISEDQFKALIPTLTDGINEKEINTVYTLYQFDSNEANTWYLNPAYAGRINDLKGPKDVESNTIPDYNENFRLSDSLQNQYNSDPNKAPNGVYRLNDIIVWVEDTGDYKDANPGAEGSDGLFNGVGFDQALYVNIPSNALPLQIAEITTNENNEVNSYQTNLNNPAQSSPLRLFYAVGLQDEIKTLDGQVDLTKVSQTYLDSHKDKNGNVYFTSNYFTTGENNYEDKSHGDPVVTFSPSEDNRYYIFQKALPIYSKAYQKINNQLIEVDDINWNGGILSGIFSSYDEAIEKTQNNEVALISTDTLNKGIENQEDIFFIAIDYYKDGTGFNPGNQVQYVVPRTGKQLLASDYINLHRDNMLCWLNLNVQSDNSNLILDFNKDNPSAPDNNWVLATNPGGLRVADLVNEEKENNLTDTATNYYSPIISGASTAHDGVMINMYLGNNGILSVEDDLLLVTKMVENEQGQYDPNNSTEFNYTLNIDNFKGTRNVIKVIRDEEANTWRRVIDTISVVTDNSGFLHSSVNNDVLAQVGYKNGNIDPSGEGYYIYIPDENPIGSTVVYSYNDNIGIKVQKGNTIEFLTTAYLIPVGESFEKAIQIEAVPATDNSNASGFVIATMDTNSGINSSEITLNSNYYIRSTYLTQDNITFDANGNTNIKLKSGEGLLFNSIGNGTKYTVTETLSEELVKNGWNLKSVNGQTESKSSSNGSLSYIIDKEKHAYTASGTTSSKEISINYINKIGSEEVNPNITIKKTQSLNNSKDKRTDQFEVKGNDLVTYYLTVENTGKAIAENVIVTDKVPEGLTVEGAISNRGTLENGTITWNLGNMDPGTSYELSFNVRVPLVNKTTQWKNFAIYRYQNNPKGSNKEEPSNEVLIKETIDGVPSLEIEKLQAQGYGVGTKLTLDVNAADLVTYYLKIKNISSVTAENVIIADQIPEGLSLVEINDNGVNTEGILTWNIGNLEAGQSKTVSFTISVPKVENRASWTNIATTRFRNNPDGENSLITSNPVVIREEIANQEIENNPVEIPELSILKEQSLIGDDFTLDYLQYDESYDYMTYRITVQNISDITVSNVVISDIVPTGTTYITGYYEYDGSEPNVDSNVITWIIPEIGPQDSAVVIFTVMIDEGTTQFQNTARVILEDIASNSNTVLAGTEKEPHNSTESPEGPTDTNNPGNSSSLPSNGSSSNNVNNPTLPNTTNTVDNVNNTSSTTNIITTAITNRSPKTGLVTTVSLWLALVGLAGTGLVVNQKKNKK